MATITSLWVFRVLSFKDFRVKGPCMSGVCSLCVTMHDAFRAPGRLKASLERLQRLTQGYADALIDIFPGRAAALGAALGLEQERVTVRAGAYPTPNPIGLVLWRYCFQRLHTLAQHDPAELRFCRPSNIRVSTV